jgi:hypothetical protein
MNSFFQKDDSGKRYAISRRDGDPFGVAGIWENWKDPATRQWIRTFAIITVPANDLCRDHPRSHTGHPRQGELSPLVRRRGGSERPACTLPVRRAGRKSDRQAFRIAPKRWSTKAPTALRVHRAAVPNDRRVGCWQHPAAERNDRLRDSPLDARKPDDYDKRTPAGISDN